jgi:hypothetical protein
MFYTNMRSPVKGQGRGPGIGDTWRVARRIVLGTLFAAGVAIGVAWGLKAAVGYFGFLVLALALVWAASAGGEFIADLSRRRFDYRDRP